ncbi:MAG: ABC transporter ATP-binding protein/permease [Firmicutes bacterium]|nr:ABC transporter ATP-binding protein/permease [Bacillota bacterium]
MVRLEHVKKYFFHRKKNEIAAIDDTSLELTGKGLVALLGPSGSGKTTLLNAIGGLDRVDSGSIHVNGENITGRFSGKVDMIRTLNIGYVFQDYNLVENMTVYENVALALRMVGVTSQKEIDEKVNYVLEKVDMYRYRNRNADTLSGGERQRVGIARAIIKDPAIIIADEPTGNLDSKNTLEVMNIIRAIAEEKLVILVTHEERLAEFYASRIIRIQDGKVVSDRENRNSGNLDYKVENKIYLKDIEEHKRLTSPVYKVDFYNDSNDQLDIDIVLKNGNIYIRTNNPEDRIEIIDENSGIELVDEHYKEMTKEEVLDYDFDLDVLKSSSEKRYRSIIDPSSLLKRGFKTVSDYSTLKKVLLIGFAIAAMFITYAVSMFFGVLNISDEEFAGTDKSYLMISGKNIDVATYREYEKSNNYNYVMPGDSRISLEIPFDNYIQTMSFKAVIEGSLSDVGRLEKSELLYGNLPKTGDEIVIDKMLLKSVIEDQSTAEVGASRVRDFLNREVVLPNVGELKVVGISNKQSPCIYALRSEFINIIANSKEAGMGATFYQTQINETSDIRSDFIDYELKKDEVQLERGKWPSKNYEVMVNFKNKSDSAYKIGKKLKTPLINDKALKIVGYYSDPYDSDFMLVNNEMIKYDLIGSNNVMTICPINKQDALANLREQGVNVKDAFQESKDRYVKDKWSSMKSMLVMAGIILAISFIEIFLMIRASFLSRIREVGVYRAIGVKKADIYKLFSGEIFAITTLAGLPAFLFMALVLMKLSKVTYFSDIFLMNPPVVFVCLILIYGLNLLFGLLPVWKVIRKTPAEILSRTDIG